MYSAFVMYSEYVYILCDVFVVDVDDTGQGKQSARCETPEYVFCYPHYPRLVFNDDAYR
jgi:hypothetical protein